MNQEYAGKVAIIGAGKIGRGVVGLLFSRANYHLILADNNVDALIQLSKKGCYDVGITDGKNSSYESVSNFGVAGAPGFKSLSEELLDCDVVACCVYEGAFESIAETLAEAIKSRMADDIIRPFNILLCVNALNAPARIRALIDSHLNGTESQFATKYVGISQVMVLAAGIPSGLDADEWTVMVSSNPKLEIDAESWVGKRLEIKGIAYITGAGGILVRKVYCGNMRHAMAGFMGKCKKLDYIYECHSDLQIRGSITGAFAEAHAAVALEYHLDPIEDIEWLNFIDSKLESSVKDPIERVIADIRGKLSRDNRFVGPALLCLKHNIVPYYLARGIAYGLYCLSQEQGASLNTVSDIRNFAQQVCGLTEDDELLLHLIEESFIKENLL